MKYVKVKVPITTFGKTHFNMELVFNTSTEKYSKTFVL